MFNKYSDMSGQNPFEKLFKEFHYVSSYNPLMQWKGTIWINLKGLRSESFWPCLINSIQSFMRIGYFKSSTKSALYTICRCTFVHLVKMFWYFLAFVFNSTFWMSWGCLQSAVSALCNNLVTLIKNFQEKNATMTSQFLKHITSFYQEQDTILWRK